MNWIYVLLACLALAGAYVAVENLVFKADSGPGPTPTRTSEPTRPTPTQGPGSTRRDDEQRNRRRAA